MRARGFTLVELMIVIVLLAIAVGIAVPSYRGYVMRTHRTDASATLLKVRTAQEKYFLQNDRYADDDELVAAPPDGLGFPRNSEHGFYQIGVVTDGTSFTATATALGGQLDDEDCRRLTINERGEREAFTAVDGENTEKCWR